jgi:2-polyprenyl-6-methoxyphenol hydroxylase-like FAD-dependent oxidoreductase
VIIMYTDSIVLKGDSAHSTGGTLGQGANSALMDVIELDRCLETYSDDIPKAIEAFSKKQVVFLFHIYI